MPNKTTKYRIDMIWIDKQGTIVADFKVDRTVYSKSIKIIKFAKTVS